MPPSFFDAWVDDTQLPPPNAHVRILSERRDERDSVMNDICEAVKDHLVGADVLARMNYARAAAVVRANLPHDKRARSADIGEILATEYVIRHTTFTVPLKKLRYKDDRDLALRGDDIIGFDAGGRRMRILKGEVKSRAALGQAVVREACEGLGKHDARPNPDTLTFIARILRLQDRDAEAERIEDIQTRQIRYADITHLVFTLSGNDPTRALRAHAVAQSSVADHRLVGLRVYEHGRFVASVFNSVARIAAENERSREVGEAIEPDGAPGDIDAANR